MTCADVVVIGGGVMGTSAAYHLALRGCKNILILERGNDHSEGSTSKATGGFRAQFSTDVNVRLSLLSRSKLMYFEDELDIDPGFRQSGYLFAASSDRELVALNTALEVQHVAGLKEARAVQASEVARLNPFIRMNGLLGGTFCPTDGFISPMNILRGYVGGAQRLGVKIKYGVEVLDLIVISGSSGLTKRISEVVTSEGNISCGSVVNAAGAWAGLFGSLAHTSLPVKPMKRQVAVTQPTDILRDSMPMTIFTEDGFHFRVRDGRVLFLWPGGPTPSETFDTSFDHTWLDSVRERVGVRIPLLKNIEIDTPQCVAGLYEMSPDKHAILGRAPGLDNFYLANGSSGHGVMHAPALGQLLAEIMVEGEASSLNVHSLRPGRFAEGQLNETVEFL